VYSCTLIRNDLDLRTEQYPAKSYEDGSDVIVPACDEPRWRGRYNEDTDLCLRALKKGWCTILFNIFLSHKVATMTMRGGNTDVLYSGDGRAKMAESLRQQHPDCARVRTKWGRQQHAVDYKRAVLRARQLQPDACIPKWVSEESGMKLVPILVRRLIDFIFHTFQNLFSANLAQEAA
jgi:hypothetical protein